MTHSLFFFFVSRQILNTNNNIYTEYIELGVFLLLFRILHNESRTNTNIIEFRSNIPQYSFVCVDELFLHYWLAVDTSLKCYSSSFFFSFCMNIMHKQSLVLGTYYSFKIYVIGIVVSRYATLIFVISHKKRNREKCTRKSKIRYSNSVTLKYIYKKTHIYVTGYFYMRLYALVFTQ